MTKRAPMNMPVSSVISVGRLNMSPHPCVMKLTHTAIIERWCATKATSSSLPSLMAHGSTNSKSLQMYARNTFYEKRGHTRLHDGI